MLVVYTERLLDRLAQLVDEIQAACYSGLDYYDRLREFKRFCDDSPIFANYLGQLPQAQYDFTVDWREMPNKWPAGQAGYGLRWSAIRQMVDGGPHKVDEAWLHLSSREQEAGLRKVTELFVLPIYHLLVDQAKSSSTMLYSLLRYKRWAEWFETTELRGMYRANGDAGERSLDQSLRRFLFESGIDYPFSQPASPRGKVDVVAGLETDDPLVLEIKVWDSSKRYRENRVRDGLRQAMKYASQYGKDKGHIVVFNLDEKPLSFTNQSNKSEWPPRVECGGRAFYFIDVHIGEQTKPISGQDKGKQVRVNEINLANLLRAIQ